MTTESQSHGRQPSSVRLITSLGAISLVSGVLVVSAYQVTLPRVLRNQQLALERSVFSVLSGATTKTDLLVEESGVTKLPVERAGEANAYAGFDAQGRLVGIAMEASSRGYSAAVRILYGYAPERECITGFTVLQSTETPGIGDRISSDPGFLANFDCLEARLNPEKTALVHEIETVKHGKKTGPWQIDAISGATVTSKAVGKGLRESTNKLLPLLAQHADTLASPTGH